MGVRAGVRPDMPFYPGHGVAGQPHLVLEVQALRPLLLAVCALGIPCSGVRVRIPRPPGLRSICLRADLGQLGVVAASSSGFLQWLLASA